MNVALGLAIPGIRNLKTFNVDTLTVNNTLTVNGNGNDDIGLKLINKHIKTQQNVKPTISSGTLTNATDVAGSFSFISSGLAGVQTVVTFESVYETPPVVLISPKNVNAAVDSIGYYVTSTVNNFTIHAAYTTSQIPYEFFYMVIQSN